TIDDCWKGWAIFLRQKQKKLIMLPSEIMIWQPEFTDKILSRKPGAVHSRKPGAVQKALLIGLMSDAIPKAHRTEAINLQSVLLIFDS
ncbi:hypothetical protein BTB79_RS22770, partial [Escherichia coli]